MSKERLLWIDQVKGFSILLVVVGHLYLFTFGTSDSVIFTTIQSFHMHLFMFMSGYVAYISPISSANCVAKMARRILTYIIPAFAVGGVVWLFCEFICPSVTFLYNPVIGYWYLKSLAIFCFVQFFLMKCNALWKEILLIATAFLLFYYGWRNSGFLTNLLCLEHNVCFFPFFILGYYSRRFHVVEYLSRKNILFSVSFLCYFVCVAIQVPSHFLNNLVQRYIVPIFAVVFIVYYFVTLSTDNRLTRWLVYMGKNSLDIYLYHFFFLWYFNMLDLRELYSHLSITNNYFISFVLSILLAIVLMYISVFIGKVLKTSEFVERYIYGKLL